MLRYFATVLLIGLRDYGTAQWEGGSADCDHVKPTTNYNKGFNARWGNGDGTAAQKQEVKSAGQYSGTCKKCGALRVDAQIGLEQTPEEFIAKLVDVFREVRRVLKNDGVLWVNIGDSYAGSGRGNNPNGKQGTNKGTAFDPSNSGYVPDGCKPKDLLGIPWMLAFALRADGWYLRSEIIWHKPNPMPESVTDRPTKSHEQIFLLSKSPRYFYDAEAIKEPIKDTSVARLIQDVENQKGGDRVPGKTNGAMKAVKFGGNNPCPDTRLQSGKEWNPKMAGGGSGVSGHSGYFDKDGNPLCGVMANKKSVWSITTRGYKEAHFACYPPQLIEPCILAGSRPGDTVLDPFGGSGTTAEVANKFGRKAVLIELNPEYCELIMKRNCQQTLWGGVEAPEEIAA